MAIDLCKRKIIPQKMSFKALEDSISRDLIDFDEYSFLLESTLEQKKSKLLNKIGEKVKTDEEYSEDEIIEFYIDDLNQIGAVFPSFFRKSLFISLYSLLEHELQKLCKKIKFSSIKKHKFSDCDEVYVNKTRSYIISSCNIDSESLNQIFDKIDVYRVTRNILVHEGSRVYHGSKKYKKIEEFISTESEKKFIEVTNSGYMFFEKEFIDDFMETIKNLFKELFHEINIKNEFFKS